MDGAIQDDELWRRAFSANAGLFFDDQLSDFGPLLTGDDPAAATAAAGVADAALGMPPPSPAPASSNVASLAPMPFVAAAAPAPAIRQQQQQQRHQPHMRVQIACRPSTLVAAPPPPPPPAPPESENPPSRPAPPPSQRQQRKIGPAPESARSRANLQVTALSSNAAESTTPPLEQQAAAEGPSAEQQQGAPNQRGGESFSRKRDRAKLLRQQMNDGLDNLHEALVEISTSGANLSASAATSLIPTRGPRRAAVVACSAGLVRDLISTCIALRKDKVSLSGRLAEAQRQQQQQQQQQGASDGSSAHLQGGAGAAAGGDGETAARKKHDDGGSHGRDSGGAAAAAGVASSAKVFGQLLSLSVFGFLGPQSLEEASKVSREWRDKCTWDCNWSTLCVSRWRIGPEQRHAEVWRAPDGADGKGKGVARSVVSPPAPPPTWQSIYGRLHRDVHAPSGAFCPSHMVIGRSFQEGVAVWIALNRRSNGMTGRSVMTQGSTGLRMTEV
ncbi:unnamed protein product, partial [Ectocarpus fasciculatus]